MLLASANVCNNLKFIMEENDEDMKNLIQSICNMYYPSSELDLTVLTDKKIDTLEKEFESAQKIGKNVVVGKLTSFNNTEIDSLAIKYNIVFWDATLKTDSSCLTHVVEGFGACTAIAFGLSVIHYSYTKSIIVYDSTSPITECGKEIYDYLIFEDYPGPELIKIDTQSEIDQVVTDNKDDDTTIILNFLTGGETGSNSEYLFKKRNSDSGKFNIISFHNVNGKELLGYDNPKDTLILSESLLQVEINGTKEYLDIDQFIMYIYLFIVIIIIIGLNICYY